MDTYNSVWTILESLGLLFVLFVFFHDPIRRWNFFGYRPTAVIGIFDPLLEKVIFSKINGAWSFNQGGMYDSNLFVTVESILRRELGLPDTRFKLSYTRPLGTLRIRERTLVNRARLSTVSLFSTPRGKGYLACYVRARLDGVEGEIRPGAGVDEVRIVSFDEARRLVREDTIGEHQPRKQKFILSMLHELENYARGIRAWEEPRLKPEPAANRRAP